MKKRLSKVVSLCLAAALTAGLAGCSSSSSSGTGNQTVTNGTETGATAVEGDSNAAPQDISMQLVFWGAEAPTEKAELIKELESKLNVNLTFNYVLAANAAEKTTTTISGGDNMPDVLCIINDIMRSQIVQDAGEAGMFWDLTDYLDDYPNLKENIEPFKNSMTYGGQIIGIPRRTLGRVGGMLLREDWLENLNLEEPKTLDDFYNVFHAFTYDDPDGNGVDDTTGLALFGGAYVRPLMIAAGIHYDWYVDEETGEVRNFCTDENFQTYLDFMKKLYDEGLVSQDFAAMNAVQGREVFNTQKAGAYTANYGNISGGDAYQALYDTNLDAKITCITDVIQPDGTHACETSVGFYGMYVIPKSSVETEEELRGILSFFDGLCSDECVDIEMKGVEGVHYKYNDKNEFEWIDKSKFDAESKGISSFNVAPLIELTMSLNGFYNASTYYDFQTKEGVVDYMPVNSWFAANSDDAAVDTVVKQAATNYVMGEASAEDVSAAVKEWLNGGGQSHADDWTEQYSKLAK